MNVASPAASDADGGSARRSARDGTGAATAALLFRGDHSEASAAAPGALDAEAAEGLFSGGLLSLSDAARAAMIEAIDVTPQERSLEHSQLLSAILRSVPVLEHLPDEERLKLW